MQLETDWINYDGPTGPVSAYLARPSAASGPLPGIIVIQEIWGVDAHIAELTERFAAAGYVAMAPDLYSAGGGRPEEIAPERVEQAKAFLDSLAPGQWTSILGDEQRRAQELGKLPEGQGPRVDETLGTLFGRIGDVDPYVALLRAAVAFLRAHPACRGRAVASTGYCLGGGLSLRLACEEPELGAAALYYGSAPAPEQIAQIRCPIRCFYGEDDERLIAGVPELAGALQAAGVDHEIRVYPGTPHAFFNDTRPSYRIEAARDAWARTLAFFAAALDPVALAPVPEG